MRTVIENRDYLGENGYPALIDAGHLGAGAAPEADSVEPAPAPSGRRLRARRDGRVLRLRRRHALAAVLVNGRRTYRCSNAMEGRNPCTDEQAGARRGRGARADRQRSSATCPTLDDWLREQAQGHRQEQAQRGAGAEGRQEGAAGHGEAAGAPAGRLRAPARAEARPVLRRATKVEAERDEAEQRVPTSRRWSPSTSDDPDVDAARDLYMRLAGVRRRGAWTRRRHRRRCEPPCAR